MAGDIQKYYDFLANRYSNPDVWGTEGAYFYGLPNLGAGDSRHEIEPIGTIGVNLNGQQYVRTGTADNSRFDPFGGGYFYDPTYGWVVPSSVASAYGDSTDDSALYGGLGIGLAALPVAAATFGGALGGGGNAVGDGLYGAGEAVDAAFGPGAGLSSSDGLAAAIGEYGVGTGGISGVPISGAAGAAGAAASNNTLMDAIVQATQGAVNSMPSSLPGPLGGLTNILSGNGGLADWLRVGGAVGPSILGYLGASKQADSYGNLMNQYFGLGAPYRNLLQQSYQPGFDISKEPGFQNAMDTALNTYMRAASAGNAQGVSSGNPFDNPGALMESQKYLLGNLALPYLQNYRSGLSSAGQLGLGPSASFGGAQVGAQGGKYDAIGYGLGELLNPKPDYFKQFANLFSPRLSTGGGLV